jgi:predicted nucleotidyltransferase
MPIEQPHTPEDMPTVAVSPPPTETLLHLDETSFWDVTILTDPTLREVAMHRLEAHTALATYDMLVTNETMSAKTALLHGHIDSGTLTTTYNSLTTVLTDDPLNSRLALYVPFELLPPSSATFEDKALQVASERFSTAYLEAWREQLAVHDLRANFLDGDIPESDFRDGPLPRAVKAIHLAPFLIERGVLSVETLLDEVADSQDSVLQESVHDALLVMADKGLLTDEVRATIVARGCAWLTAHLPSTTNTNETIEGHVRAHTPTEIVHHAQTTLDTIANQYDATRDDMAPERQKWLIQDETNRALLRHAQELATHIQSGHLTPEGLTPLMTSNDPHAIRLAILSIRCATDQNTHIDLAPYAPHVSTLLSHTEVTVREDAESTLMHLHGQGHIDTATLLSMGITSPNIDAPHKERTQTLERFTQDIGTTLLTLSEKHPRLAQYIYPTATLLGSRTKGYGRESADLDVAVFVRPNAPFTQRAEIEHLLREVFTHEHVHGKVMPFWLTETEHGLWMRHDADTEDRTLGTSMHTHPLRGVWCGEQDAIRELHHTLLPEYLYSKGKEITGEDARTVWQEELERDTLQYRLMHKGYARIFPPRGGIHTPHSDALEGDSMFYDSGFRRLATKLYLERVFLPQLERQTQNTGNQT